VAAKAYNTRFIQFGHSASAFAKAVASERQLFSLCKWLKNI
jgi:hypothetical protein